MKKGYSYKSYFKAAALGISMPFMLSCANKTSFSDELFDASAQNNPLQEQALTVALAQEIKTFDEVARHLEENYILDINWKKQAEMLKSFLAPEDLLEQDRHIIMLTLDQVREGDSYTLASPALLKAIELSYASHRKHGLEQDPEDFITKTVEALTLNLDPHTRVIPVSKHISASDSGVKSPDVTVRKLDDDITYIKLKSFTAGVAAKIQLALYYHKKAYQPKAFILDLRGNYGGLEREAEKVSDLFLEEGLIATFYSPNPNKVLKAPQRARYGDVIDGYPLAVLIDDRSISASELTAAALKENGRALVVGETSYGKGTVQSYKKISGSEKYIKSTTSFYLTPTGNSVQGIGLTPNIYVADPDGRNVSYRNNYPKNPFNHTHYPINSEKTCVQRKDTGAGGAGNPERDVTHTLPYPYLVLACAVEQLRGEEKITHTYSYADAPSF